MYNVRVNSIILEIPAKSVLVLNSLVLDLFDPTSRGVTSSNSIKISLSGVNKEALGFPTPISSTSESYTKLFSAEILLGKNVISIGSVRLKNVDLDKMEAFLQFQDGQKDFYNDLDRNASDIDFSSVGADFDLEFTQSVFNGIANITPGQIWAYKDLQTAINGVEADIPIFTRPCYSVRELLKEFIKSTGFTVDFSKIEGGVTEIDKLLLTSHADKFIVSDFRQHYTDQSFTDGQKVNIDANEFNFKTTIISLDTLQNNTYSISLNLKGTVFSEEGATIKFVNDVSGDEFIDVPRGGSFLNFTGNQYEIGSTTFIEIIGNVTFLDVFVYVIIDEKNIADVETNWGIPAVPATPVVSDGVLDGYFFLGAQNLPDFTMLDLFRMFWSLYFIKIDIDVFTKSIGFRLFGQELALSAIDITEFLSGDGVISPTGIFSRQNTFSWTNDRDTFMGFSNFIFRTGNSIDLSITDYINLPLAASFNKEGTSLAEFARVEVYNRSADFDASDSESRIELTNRLLIENGTRAVFQNLNWGFLFDKYYSPLFSRLTGKRHSIKMFMTFEVFKIMSDQGFVFIRNKGLFFVENISAFDEGRPVSVKLLFLN